MKIFKFDKRLYKKNATTQVPWVFCEVRVIIFHIVKTVSRFLRSDVI